MINKQLLVTRWMDGIVTALIHENRTVELSFEAVEHQSLVGNIYTAKVTKIVNSIHAAFVEIEGGISCYLDLSKSDYLIRTSGKKTGEPVVGDELLVQTVRDAVKTKAPMVTSEISLAGRYLVLNIGNPKIFYSSKLPQESRDRLRVLIEEELGKTEERSVPFGWIVRTNAADAEPEALLTELHQLESAAETLLAQAPHRPIRTCMYRSPSEYLNRIRDLRPDDYEEVLTDDPLLFEELSDWLTQHQPEDLEKLRLYKDRLLPMHKLYSLNTRFEEALSEQVWLKSGGTLVIQPTEALTVVDVNSGKYVGGRRQEETFLKINLEAAVETARQLRLRNISGIILIDFINMKSKEAKEEVIRVLSKALKADPQKAVFVDMTSLGLVEVTRKRGKVPFSEQLGRERRASLRS
ncbi:MAG: ribonuclease E/G [Lachnospiraceae bacterium]|nr:ribonuclease E/G [Lachnospiraceae bacterium]